MMGAVQPFISGAISKTINMPAEATVDEVAEAYVTAWKLGLKAVAIYRDGSKRTQPLNTGKGKAETPAAAAAAIALAAGDERRLHRRKLPDERKSITHKFDIAGHEGYITVGMYEDGTPGEIFVTMSKQGSTISGLMDSFATAISLRAAVRRAAAVPGRQVRAHALRAVGLHQESADSVRQVDRRLPVPMARVEVPRRRGQARSRHDRTRGARRYGDCIGDNGRAGAGRGSRGRCSGRARDVGERQGPQLRQAFINQADAPPCPDCGCIMVRNGTCYKCMNCGATSGCS